jgi:hypothetical protein
MAILSKSLERRINALEAQLNPPPPLEVQINIVPAGMTPDHSPDGDSVRATDLSITVAPSSLSELGGDPLPLRPRGRREAPPAASPTPPPEERMLSYL